MSTETAVEFVKSFTRPMRGKPLHFILDGFGADCFVLFDFDDVSDEFPETKGTCDILIVPLASEDFIADSICLISSANKLGVMRFLAAMGIKRFDAKVKAAFYESSSPLRTTEVSLSPGSGQHSEGG